jgi:hypothetical protein
MIHTQSGRQNVREKVIGKLEEAVRGVSHMIDPSEDLSHGDGMNKTRQAMESLLFLCRSLIRRMQ